MVRCFTDPDVIHVGGEVNPVSDMEVIEMELMLADIQSLETALPKAERAAKSGDKEAKLTHDRHRGLPGTFEARKATAQFKIG